MKNKTTLPFLTLVLATLLLCTSIDLSAQKKGKKKTATSPALVTLTTSNYATETAKGLVMVDFWAPWCGPCRKMNPIIEQIASEHKRLVKVGKLNTDDSPKVAENANIQSIPTIIFYKNGKEVERAVGLVSKEELETIIKKHSAS